MYPTGTPQGSGRGNPFLNSITILLLVVACVIFSQALVALSDSGPVAAEAQPEAPPAFVEPEAQAPVIPVTGPCGDLHVVQLGETLQSIAQDCGTTPEAILQANPDLANPGLLVPGQELAMSAPEGLIPDTGGGIGSGSAEQPLPIEYIVQPGDTLSEIAQVHGISLEALLRANPQITNPGLIYPGQRIFIPMDPNMIPVTGGGG